MISDEITKLLSQPGVVLDITADSRRIQPGSLFFVLPRAEKFFDKVYSEALDQGAVLIVHGVASQKDKGHFVENIDSVYSHTLKAFYKDSFSKLKIYGLTGTNGKTSVATMLQNLLELYSVPTGLYGTVGNFFRNNTLDTGLTSSMAEDFYRFNHSNFKKGMKAVVCEVSSHALDQRRLGLDFLDGAGFTSFSQDHLDYHKSMEAYLEAKGRIFSEALYEKGFFVYPQSLKEIKKIKPLESQKTICLGGSAYSYTVLGKSFGGIEMCFKKEDKTLTGVLPLFGDYNAENFALALTFLCEHFVSAGDDDFFPDSKVFDQFKQISGRMERFKLCDFKSGESSYAVVDFSHTPDSLEKALKTLRELKPEHQLIAVFGCGGDRDAAKRPLMGKIASDLADSVVVTSDNPRTEDPQEIAAQIAQAVEVKKLSALNLDRSLAIRKALSTTADRPSLVLIAGKGHEQTQEIKGEKSFFSDQKEVKKWIVEQRLGEKL